MLRSMPLLWPSLFVAGVLAGCIGTIGDRDDSSSSRSTDEDESTLCNAADEGPSAGFTPIRRLTIREYDNAVRDLLGDDTRPAERGGIPPDESGSGFASNLTSPASELLLERYRNVAEDIAQRAVTALDDLLPCSAQDGDACATSFIETFGRRAYRRPLAEQEVAAHLGAYTRVRQGSDEVDPGSFEDGIRTVLQTILQSPHFLYRVELPGEGTEAVAALRPYELATRLSFFLWQSIPDDELLDLAESGQLGEADVLEAQTRRMLDDARAEEVIGDFHVQWLGLSEIASVDVPADVYPEFAEARDDLARETSLFAQWVTRERDGRLATLLTEPVGFVSAATAPLYEVDPPDGDELVRVDLDPERRSGLLTQAGLLAVTSRVGKTSPPVRGKFLYERVLCGPPVEPPPGDAPPFPKQVAGLTKKELFEEHRKNGCAYCHVAIDPLGFALENYDVVGRYRTVDEFDETVDASVVLAQTDVDGPVVGAVELGAKLATSAQVRACVARQWVRFALGRRETNEDACSLETLTASFEASDGHVRDLIVAIATSDAFRVTGREPTAEESP
jgi:hypothetical protein